LVTKKKYVLCSNNYWIPINNRKPFFFFPIPLFIAFPNKKKYFLKLLRKKNHGQKRNCRWINTTEVSLLEADQQQQQQQLQPPLISGLPAPSCHPSPAELLI
jgi:hypothetical protein